MKENRTKPNDRRLLILTIAAIFLLLVFTGIAIGYCKLRNVWLEQCVISDPSVQVSITSGKMVKADVLSEKLGLNVGANLALIDFDAKRREALEKIPNLRAITITRQLPDKITVVAEERSPVARMNIRGNKIETGRVVDTEGVVFIWQRGTQALPIIREAQKPGTGVGKRLSGRALAALRLLEASMNPQNADLGILEVDITKPDYILATLGNYSSAKIAWDGMDNLTPESLASLNRQLSLLVKAIRSHIGDKAVMWNATDTSTPGRIYADLKGDL